ncbi:hypothetical protein [Alkalihalobacterium chitinilyticum]|uniref:hypothetical protein n=1 Tax=Alkalihalobacterium chitinilyticum TaxID=2980103 RepID=UPI0035716684
MENNKFVNFLDQFNVLSPNHSKIYDEYTSDTEYSNYNFTIKTKVQEHLENLFRENPQSLILTGNAGDGKTRLCRIIHDQLSSNELEHWPEDGIVDLRLDFGTLRIVKDLSELRDDVILEQLLRLQESIQSRHTNKLFYLIAANEGKLTKFLSQHNELAELRREVSNRFNSFKNNNQVFSIINLLDVTSSVYVEKVLEDWNKEENWEACNSCKKNGSCIIFLNHQRTSGELVQKRIVEQYRILDYLETHITMREMLIHLSFMITGGLTCEDINRAGYKELSNHSNKIYYENFYGHHLSPHAFAEMRALRIFKALDPGNYSHSDIDDFIMNGDISGNKAIEELHQELVDDSMDMQFGYFSRKLRLYRDHDGISDHSIIEDWVQKLRRKFYFEINNSAGFDRHVLLPFQYLSDYISLFNNQQTQSSIKRNLISGLNRSFSGRLVDSKASLFATSQNLMIYDEFKSKEINIIDDLIRDDIDYLPSKFTLSVQKEIKLPMNLFIFEYLMRAQGGGTHNILREEADILIDTFKNELIKISEPEEFTLTVLKRDRDSGLFVKVEIDL